MPAACARRRWSSAGWRSSRRPAPLAPATRRVLLREVVPNIAAPLLVFVTLNVGALIVETAGLSFIGLGAQPPTADWGTMLADGRQFMMTAPHVAAIPGVAVLALVWGLNMVGDGAARHARSDARPRDTLTGSVHGHADGHLLTTDSSPDAPPCNGLSREDACCLSRVAVDLKISEIGDAPCGRRTGPPNACRAHATRLKLADFDAGINPTQQNSTSTQCPINAAATSG